MRFDLHLRSVVKNQFQAIAQEMQAWQEQTLVGEEEAAQLRHQIISFDHSTVRNALQIAGVDGSGDFPLLSYGDAFVYLATAQGTIYTANRLSGLREVPPLPEVVIYSAWIPGEESRSKQALDNAFSQLAGLPLRQVISQSDYCSLKAKVTGRASSLEQLVQGLIRPPASDTGNLAIQLRSTAELGAALRLLKSEQQINYLLVDTTLSLPLVSSGHSSLFYEHLKRLCCVEARKQNLGFFALSKSHGLPNLEALEAIARELQGLEPGKVAEHWYLRIPERELDGWTLSLVQGRRIPPPGAVSYLVRFHRTTPVIRLDMDRGFWDKTIWSRDVEVLKARERQVFEDLDYACHDQRVYGYPYPIKAAHDRSSLTQEERVALRKQLISAAVAEGMSPTLFRNPAQGRGHQ